MALAGDDGATAPRPAVVETHLSVLFFVGDRVYKLHKPVRFDFADFREREAREADSRREVALNRRLAADVYLGVADVSFLGEVVDHLVVMRRLPADDQLAALIRRGADVGPCLEQIARALVDFHRVAARAPAIDEVARAPAVLAGWEANFAETAPFVGPVIDVAADALVQRLVRRFLAGRRPLFDDRIAQAQVCDGHGDLQAEDIFCLPDGPRILDCIAFDERLRYGDVAADLAFLLMDLRRIGAPEAADALQVGYEALSGRTLPPALLSHYIAHRAYVRCKVTCLRWAQGDPDAAERAQLLHRLALEHLKESRVRLILVGGLPGTGKSTLAAGLATRVGGEVLHSDEVRKQQAGMSPDRAAPSGYRAGLYAPSATNATYRTLLDRAQVALSLGRTIVLDASWTSQAWREVARQIAAETSSDLVELHCTVDRTTAAARMARRLPGAAHGSDATAEIALAMASDADPWPSAVVIETGGTPAASLRRAVQVVRDGAG